MRGRSPFISRSPVLVDLRAEVGALRADCQAHGIELLESPVDPRAEAAVPLHLSSARYLSMQAHFDRIGPAGRLVTTEHLRQPSQ